jgi:hypothetical protein
MKTATITTRLEHYLALLRATLISCVLCLLAIAVWVGYLASTKQLDGLWEICMGVTTALIVETLVEAVQKLRRFKILPIREEEQSGWRYRPELICRMSEDQRLAVTRETMFGLTIANSLFYGGSFALVISVLLFLLADYYLLSASMYPLYVRLIDASLWLYLIIRGRNRRAETNIYLAALSEAPGR